MPPGSTRLSIRRQHSRRLCLRFQALPLSFHRRKGLFQGRQDLEEIAEKGGPKNAEHTLNHVGAFYRWHARLVDAAREKEYFPKLDPTVNGANGKLERGSEEDGYTQLQDTFLKT